VVAIAAGRRTLDDLGDLNRLYPGDPKSKTPMARMADAIVQVAREFRVQTLYDMHESWAFFSERSTNGNAFLGQTVSAGFGEDATLAARALVARANQGISVRRDWLAARVEVPPDSAKATNSLGIGRWVEGLSSLLVEMGQDRQQQARRTELHLMVARTFLQSREML
jgi:predicted deacylase